MNEQSYFHWDFFRPPIHSPSIQMGAPFLDIRDDGMRGIPNKNKAFSLDQSCALWSKDMGLDPGDGLHHVGGRVLEIRKEKSRDAARSRRGKENYEFYELAKLLPLPAAITSQLDKASIIRLSISYLKLRDFCGHGDPPWTRDNPHTNKSIKGNQRRRNTGSSTIDLFEIHQGAHILQSLDGFAFTLSADGRFLYISETVSIYLGLSQVEMAGSSMFDYVHAQDHQELADQLGLSLAGVTTTMSSPASPSVDSPNSSRAVTPPISERVPTMTPNLDKGQERTFCLRMKSTLTKRGAHTRSSGYRVVYISGQFRHQVNYSLNRKSPAPLLGLVGVAIALPPPTITELRLEADTFIMRLTPEFKIIYCENVISSLTDWRCEDLSGKEMYEFCHPGDITELKKAHGDLIVKGQVLSPSLRLLNKGGGYIWIVMCATSLYSSKTSDDPTFLAICQTISSIEHRGVIMDASHIHTSVNATKHYTRDHEQDIATSDILVQNMTSTASFTSKVDGMTTHTTSDQINNSSSLNSCESPGPFHEGDFLLDEHLDEPTKFDNKISRRKMDHPRKRKRERETRRSLEEVIDTDSEPNECSENCVSIPVSSNVSNIRDITGDMDADLMNASTLQTDSGGLDSKSAKRSTHMKSPQLPEDLSFRTISQKDTLLNCDGENLGENGIAKSSVSELEKAMDRHLPQKTSTTFGSCDNEMILKEHLHDSDKTGIHWNGVTTSQISSSESLSASAFLRHLYTSRESVIRSNGRPYCYSDLTAINMLTPPGSDLCKEQLHLNIPHISTQNKPSFQNSKESVSMINNSAEEFNMTPPSSVSPQEKMTSPFQEVDVSTNECMRMRGNNSIVSSTVKISPFSSIVDGNPEMSKGHFVSVPNYPFHTPDLSSFSHEPVSSGSLLYDTRAPTNHGSWYSPSYHS